VVLQCGKGRVICAKCLLPFLTIPMHYSRGGFAGLLRELQGEWNELE